MKNIFLIPTPNESRLWRDLDSNKLRFDNISTPNSNECTKCSNEYMYITTDSKFVRDEYITDGIEVIKATPKLVDAQGLVDRRDWKKIVMTNDLELIEDGVQQIGDLFFRWFVLNPSCENVEVVTEQYTQNYHKDIWYDRYKIIIPKEEQKQHLIDMMNGDEELGLYDESQEIKVADVFNDEKREGVKRVIHQHKVLQGLSLINPLHLRMTDNGHGEFPDGYKLTEKGIQYIIEQLNKE